MTINESDKFCIWRTTMELQSFYKIFHEMEQSQTYNSINMVSSSDINIFDEMYQFPLEHGIVEAAGFPQIRKLHL